MSLAVYNGVAAIPDDNGVLSIVANAYIEVRGEVSGDLASIYSDSAGTSGITQGGTSYQAEDDGSFVFFVEGVEGGISVKITDPNDSSKTVTLHSIAVGTAGQLDYGVTGADLLGAADAAGARSLIGASQPYFDGSVVASRASSAETISVKTNGGDDPSITDPVYITVRNATAGTGDYTVLVITSALSLTLSSGSKLGASDTVPFRLWLVCFNDGGTARLGVINCLSGTNIYPLGQSPIASSTAEGGSGAADSAQVFYTGTAVSSKPYAILGYLDYTLTTAGTWGTAPSRIQIFGQGVPLPGAILQEVVSVDAAVATGTTVMPDDDSIPQKTEGDQFMSQAITPRAAANVLEIDTRWIGASSQTDTTSVAIFQDSDADALAVTGLRVNVANCTMNIACSHRKVAKTTSATTFKVRAGANGAGTTSFNGEAGSQKYGGVSASRLLVREIMA